MDNKESVVDVRLMTNHLRIQIVSLRFTFEIFRV